MIYLFVGFVVYSLSMIMSHCWRQATVSILFDDLPANENCLYIYIFFHEFNEECVLITPLSDTVRSPSHESENEKRKDRNE